MKIGIIGAGNIAKAHYRALSTINDCEVIGVYDISIDNARKLLENSNGIAFENPEDLLEKVDGIIIATPNFCHKDDTINAILKNKHILCEKPMATSTEEALHMMISAQKTDKVMAIGFNYRYLSYVSQLKELIQKQELGDILAVKLYFKKNSALKRKTFTWRDNSLSNQTSGALGDLGIHLIDLLWFLFESEFMEGTVRSKINTYVKEKEGMKVDVDDYSEIYGQLSNKVFVNIITSKSSLTEDCGFSIEVIGTKKEYLYSSVHPNVYTITEGVKKEEIQLPLPLLVDPENEVFEWSDSFRSQTIDWINAVRHGTNKTIATFEDGLRSHSTLDLFFSKSS